MASFNKITLVAYLGRDPELRHIPSGNAVCNFSVATTEKRKNARGDAEDVTTWFRVTAWGRLAELCGQWGAKGRQVYVSGPLRQEEYTDRDGQKRTSLIVNADDIQFLDKKGENGNARDEAPSPAEKQARREALKTPETVAREAEWEDPMPF